MSDKKTNGKKAERISVKGLKVGNLPRGNPTLSIARKVDPETLPVRCQKAYERILDKGEVALEDVVKGNRHVRWSVRLLVGGLKCVEAIPEPEAEKPKAKPKVAKKATPRKTKAKPKPKAQDTTLANPAVASVA